MSLEINQDYEDAPMGAVSTRAKKILSEIKIVNEAGKSAEIKITCPILGAGEHDKEMYKVRLAVKEELKRLGHNPFFMEEITQEDAKNYLIANKIPKSVVEVLVKNNERKNDAILRCCSIIFAVAASEGALIEIGKCCHTPNEKKLKILVPKDKYHEMSQVTQTLSELDRLYSNMYTFDDVNEAEKHTEAIINKEISYQLRVNGG